MALAMVAGSFLYGPLDTLFGTRKWVAFGGNFVGVLALPWLRFRSTTGSPGLTGGCSSPSACSAAPTGS